MQLHSACPLVGVLLCELSFELHRAAHSSFELHTALLSCTEGGMLRIVANLDRKLCMIDIPFFLIPKIRMPG